LEKKIFFLHKYRLILFWRTPSYYHCWSGNAKSSSNRAYLCGFDFLSIIMSFIN